MKQIEELDKLIDAIECGRPDWDAAFLDDSKDEVSLCVLAAYRGSLDAAKVLHDALGVDAPINEDARAWILAILKAYRAKMAAKAGVE